MSEGTRRLAAIMFTDIVGYTALSQRNERLALQLLERHRSLMRPVFARHKGREVKTIGDAFMVQFESALEAVECAVEMQEVIHNQPESPSMRLEMKVGIHVGDVVQSENDVHGDAVNIASRIEPLAKGGEICISEQVYDQVRNKVPFKLAKLDPQELKNVAVPIDVYRVELPWESSLMSAKPLLPADRIAVLPFVSMSPDPNDEYFADGLTEELIDKLCKVRGLEVISRTSVMNYKKEKKNTSQIGRELNAGTVMEGSVRKAGNRIRVTAQLINANTEGHLWSSSYDRVLDDIFAVQGDIATSVVGSLPGNFSTARVPVAAQKETEDIQAYTSFLQGQALVYEPDEAPLRQSLGFFEQAIERDPSFSRAYAGMARCYTNLAIRGSIPWSEGIERGRAAAQKALSIDPDLAEAHALLADISNMADDPIEVQEKEVRRALEQNPNLADAHLALGAVESIRGNLGGFVSCTETAYQLDPLSPPVIRRLGAAYFFARREQDLLELLKRTRHLDPINYYRRMADVYFSKGDLAEAETIVNELEKIAPNNEYAHLNRGYLAALKGDRATALEMIAKLDNTHEAGWARSSLGGFIFYALGDVDKFFEYMSRAAGDHTLRAEELMHSPAFSAARKDPRLRQIFSSVGLTLPLST